MAEYCNDNFQMYEDNQDSFQFFQALVGPYFTPSISEDGTITWTNNGNLPNPDPVNVRGPIGVGIDEIRLNPDYTMTIYYTDGSTWTTPVPVRGQIGPTPDFSIGTVTTGAPGSDAAATITGTPEEPVLNLTIPQGAPGEVTAASMAPVYSTSATYAVGDYVTYNGQLYRCTTEIETAEAWTAAHWTAAAVATDVSNLKTALDQLADSKADVITDTATGAIASFEDGADGMTLKKLTVGIEPVQDLHGYDAPWPAGGGKNLINVADTSVSINNSYYATVPLGFAPTADVTYTISIDVNTTVTPFNISIGCGATGYSADIASKTDLGNGRVSLTFTPTAAQLTDKPNLFLRIPRYSTQQTATATLKNFMLEVGNTATAYAPYSNECPITGWTGANGQRTGKNLAKLSENNTGSNQNSTVLYFESGAIVTATNKFGRYGWLIPVKVGQAYIFTCKCIKDANSDFGWIFLGNEDNSWNSNSPGYLWQKAISTTETLVSYEFTATTSVLFVGIYVTATNSEGNVTVSECSLELGSTASDYAPYTGEALSISWQTEAGTVVGGTLTVEEDGSCRLVANRELYNMRNINKAYVSSYDYQGKHGAFINYALVKVATRGTGLCSVATVSITGPNDAPQYMWFGVSSAGVYWIGILDALGLTIEEFKTWLGNNDVWIWREKAVPAEYTLPSISQLSTVLGTNHIWFDCGPTEAEYPADTKMYIDGKITAAIAAALNS